MHFYNILPTVRFCFKNTMVQADVLGERLNTQLSLINRSVHAALTGIGLNAI